MRFLRLNIRTLKTFLGILIAFSIFFFLGRRLFLSLKEIKSYSWQFHPLWLSLSFLTLLFYSCCSIKPWLALLYQFGKKLPYRQGFVIFYLSKLGRYIPGKLWFLLGRIYLCEKAGIGKTEALFSSLLELSFLVLSGSLISLCSLPFVRAEIFRFFPIFLIALFFGIFTIPFFWRKIFHFVSKKILRAEISFEFSAFQFLRFLFTYLLLWCFCGLAFFLFVKSLSPISWSKFPAMMGIYASAWTVGFLNVITPSGLGVREGMLSLLLAAYLPTSTATLVALLSRIWSTTAELVLVGIAVFFRGKRTNEFCLWFKPQATMTKSPALQSSMNNHYLERLGSQKHLQERQGRAELIASILSKDDTTDLIDEHGQDIASPRPSIMSVVSEELKNSTVIVDVGAGSGLIRQCLSFKFKKRIIGVERQIDFVKIKEDMLIADALRLPFRANTVDLMLLNNVVEHIFNKERLFCEMWRVLKPDGVVYLTTGSPFQFMEPHYKLPFLSWLPKPLADRYVRWTRRGTSYQHVQFVSYFRLFHLANRSGFSVSDITIHVMLHHGQFLRTRYQKYLPLVRLLPAKILNFMLHLFSPQWFILLQKKPNKGE